MKQIIIITVLVALGICMCGCQEKVTKERHETIMTETIESESIMDAGLTGSGQGTQRTSGMQEQPAREHKRTETTVIIEGPEEIEIK